MRAAGSALRWSIDRGDSYEAVEIAAVMFSKLPVPRAAEVFGLLAPDLARSAALVAAGTLSQATGLSLPAL